MIYIWASQVLIMSQDAGSLQTEPTAQPPIIRWGKVNLSPLHFHVGEDYPAFLR